LPSVEKNLSLLFFINILVAVYWNMTGTFIPLFIRSLNASVFQVSLVLFIGGLVSTAITLPSGFLCDRYGRRKLIILSMMFLSSSPLLYAMANTWEETFLYTILNMVAFSLFMPARMTVIADSVKSKTLATTYGVMNLAWPIGGIFGPMLGGFIADNYGWTAFFYFLCIIAFVCTLLSFFITESMKKSENKGKKSDDNSFNRELILTLTFFFLMHIIGNIARGILGTVFPFYLTETFHKSKTETGLFFSIGFGMATIIAQFPSGLLADKIGRKKMMIYSVFLVPFLSLLLPFANDYFSTLLVYMAITGLWSATWPASVAYLVNISPASRMGFIIGIRQAAVRLGFTIGPLIGGFLWDTFDVATSFYTATFFFAVSLVLLSLLKE